MANAADKEASITVNDKKYAIASLTGEARKLVSSYRFAQDEIKRLRAQLMVAQTAANALAAALVEKLPKEQ